jgi:cytochrome b6-f complex iron-sulfur subunit
MPEDKKVSGPQEVPGELGRRQFFIRMGLGSVAVSSFATAVLGYKFLSPKVLYEPSPIVNAGKPERYRADSVTLDLNAGIYVVHEKEGLFALTAICAHLGCLTIWKPELGTISCPCHGSQFTREGMKTTGPATGPLPWLRMWLSDEGDLIVDRSTVVPAKQFVRI